MSASKPVRGALDWDVVLNAKLDDLDLTNATGSNAVAANGTYAPISTTLTTAAAAAAYVPAKVASALDYTGATDATSALQTLLNAASAVAVATSPYVQAKVITLPGVLKLGGLTLPAQTDLEMLGTKVTPAGSGTIVTAAGSFWRIAGLAVTGGGAGVGANGIVVPTGSTQGLIEGCRFDGLSGRAILLAAGSMACTVRDVFADNCLLTTAGLAAKTGVLEIAGTDHHIYGNVEITASRSSLSSASAYAGAVVVSGDANFLEHVLAEISDFGFNVSGADNILTGCRADLNRGHGFEISGTGTFTGCIALRNGRETNNTYDGFNVTAGVGTFTGCIADSSSGGGFTHRYGFNDTQNSDSNKNFYSGCKSIGHTTQAFKNTAAGAAIAIPDAPRIGTSGATPSVDQITNAYFANGGAVTVTNFTKGFGGQRLTVYGDGLATIQHNGSTFILKGSVDALPPGGQTMSFINNNGTWFETGRSF